MGTEVGGGQEGEGIHGHPTVLVIFYLLCLEVGTRVVVILFFKMFGRNILRNDNVNIPVTTKDAIGFLQK